MKLIAPSLAAAILALGLVAGAGARPVARASDPGNQIISALNQLVSKISADRGKCTKMAADIRAWKSKHSGDFARWRAWGKHLSTAQKKAYAPPVGVEGVADPAADDREHRRVRAEP
jgi:outer membrane murein-binding lipoprotein Lpp